MKYLRLENPNHEYNNVIIEKLGWNATQSLYFLKYYDLTLNSKMYTVLEYNLLRNPYKIDNMDDLIYNCKYLDIETLPNIIKCVERPNEKYKQIICLDIYKYDNNYYMDNRIYTKIYINDCNETKEINGLLCHRILYDTVQKFHKLQTSKNIYYVNIIELNNPDKTFTYYNDITNDEYYITRDIYELCLKNDIKMNSTPRIINNKNTYSILKEQIDELVQKTKLKAEEEIVSLEKKKINANKIIIFKDKTNNKLYIKQDDYKNNNTTKVINNNIYNEVNENELDNLNKKYFIITIFLKEEKNLQLTIYTYNRIKYIAKDIINMFNINTSNRKKIKVNGVINYAVSENEIKMIQNEITTDTLYKKITPVQK